MLKSLKFPKFEIPHGKPKKTIRYSRSHNIILIAINKKIKITFRENFL